MSDQAKDQDLQQNQDQAVDEQRQEQQIPPLGEEEAKQQFEQFMEAVAKLAAEKEDIEQKFLRLQADFDNFRKRSRQEKDDTVKSANSRLVGVLLPVLDNFARALTSLADSPEKEGVELIYRQLLYLLEQEGLKAIVSEGVDFDPNVHDAVTQENAGEESRGKVIAEVQKGYTFNGKLLRPAMVRVGK